MRRGFRRNVTKVTEFHKIGESLSEDSARAHTVNEILFTNIHLETTLGTKGTYH